MSTVVTEQRTGQDSRRRRRRDPEEELKRLEAAGNRQEGRQVSSIVKRPRYLCSWSLVAPLSSPCVGCLLLQHTWSTWMSHHEAAERLVEEQQTSQTCRVEASQDQGWRSVDLKHHLIHHQHARLTHWESVEQRRTRLHGGVVFPFLITNSWNKSFLSLDPNSGILIKPWSNMLHYQTCNLTPWDLLMNCSFSIHMCVINC